MNVHSGTIHCSRKVRTTQMAIHRRAHKPSVHPHDGLLLGHRKEHAADMLLKDDLDGSVPLCRDRADMKAAKHRLHG